RGERRRKDSTSWRIFSLKELSSATNNFNYDNKLGEGRFGSVYWGQLWDGSQVFLHRVNLHKLCIILLQHTSVVHELIAFRLVIYFEVETLLFLAYLNKICQCVQENVLLSINWKNHLSCDGTRYAIFSFLLINHISHFNLTICLSIFLSECIRYLQLLVSQKHLTIKSITLLSEKAVILSQTLRILPETYCIGSLCQSCSAPTNLLDPLMSYSSLTILMNIEVRTPDYISLSASELKASMHGAIFLQIAVKRLKVWSHQAEQEFAVEIEVLGRVRHKNLLSLRGYCAEGKEHLIVYDYMPNLSLHSHLHGHYSAECILDWGRRMSTAVGSAEGIAYLHHRATPHIIHQDIKASNVLLDTDFQARLADFGFAKLIPDELVCGKRPVEKLSATMKLSITEWALPLARERKFNEIADPKLNGNYVEAELTRVVLVALFCAQNSPEKRPTVLEVVDLLKGASKEKLSKLENDDMFRPEPPEASQGASTPDKGSEDIAQETVP
ncbi:unnamed protein product, partial [Musa acuminata subsp. burmannicoides]